jgi:hypothetical protein
MVIKKDIVIKKKVVIPKNRINETNDAEDPFVKRRRERREKEAIELANKKQAEKDALKEKNRKEVIIRAHLDKLEAKIREKDLLQFWAFPDRAGFIKIGKNYGCAQMMKLMNKDLSKYVNRKIVLFSIKFEHNKPDTSTHREFDTWLRVDNLTFKVNPKGELKADGSCHYIWKTNDFKLTKFSFKLLETIMYPIADRVFSCTSMMGFPVSYVVRELKRKKINFDDVLKPLAGV